MASVSSLDQDMRKLRLERYTSQAANEVRDWIEGSLGERLPAGDVLECLKDGVILCKLANLVLPAPGIKYKASSMPFVQMENISHFLTACELAPLNMPAHDRFLTVDLYDNKDPAQVIQCLSAFSRSANAVNPARFRQVIGPKRPGGTSPTRRAANGGNFGNSTGGFSRHRGGSSASQGSEGAVAQRAVSPALTGGSNSSKATEGGSRQPAANVSSWSKRSDEGKTAPAWNIHQYGYMGGASQGNQGISFGARRQIITPDANVPSPVEKERRRKEQEAEAQRLRNEEREAEGRRETEQAAAEEERQKVAEEQKWEEEARQAREKERLQVERERKQWEEEERRWREDEERRRKEEEQQAAVSLAAIPASSNLRGQYLSQDQAEQRQPAHSTGRDTSRRVSENDRIRELERQLEEAKERERQYHLERDRRMQTPEPQAKQTYPTTQSVFPNAPAEGVDERESLRQEWSKHQDTVAAAPSPSLPSRPLPNLQTKPTAQASPQTLRITVNASTPQAETQPPVSPSSPLPRPLPDPTPYFNTVPPANRTDRFLANNAPPVASQAKSYFPQELGMTSTSERASEDARRAAGQAKTKAGGWASKSLLEREMERERERQREWEEAQMQRSQRAPGASRPAGGGLLGPRELKR